MSAHKVIFHFRYIIFCLFNKHVKTLHGKAVFHLFTDCMDGLFHKKTEWCIKYGVIKTIENCFNLPNNVLMLCFDKLTGEHTNQKTLLKFVHFVGVYL